MDSTISGHLHYLSTDGRVLLSLMAGAMFEVLSFSCAYGKHSCPMLIVHGLGIKVAKDHSELSLT